MADRSGQQLGNYRLTRKLGQGGFADVYLGEHIYLRTLAAVKVLQTRISDENDLENFLNEARTIAHLSHPNIVRVLDFGVTDETPFLVLDYAPNGTLRQLYPKGTQLPISTILVHVKHIADALQYAHDEKVIHRDIKPENILLGRRNEVLLSDFGIATIAHRTASMQTNIYKGTAAYTAPEQLQGKPVPASDQYALAIMVYEWLCGQLPYQGGSDFEVAAQHLTAPIPSLRMHNNTLSPSVEAVVHRAMSKDPKERYPTVLAFAANLELITQSGWNATTAVDPLQSVPSPLPSQEQTSKGPDRVETKQPVQTLAQYDWETIVQMIRIKETPRDWQVHLSSAQKFPFGRYELSGYIASIFFLIISLITLFISEGIIAGMCFAILGVICLIFARLSPILDRKQLENTCLILLPAGLLEGDLRKAEPRWVIDYTSTHKIQARKQSVKVTRLQDSATKPRTIVIRLSAFVKSEELALNIERAFFRFKHKPTKQ